ncbi:hypothetical protein [Virgibacillus senegalensis]|uniref:hypothetical protein n=1 Tax=Virgibacillus senegalensis TaxID=1499679 RepID=UPI0018FE59AF|nr:hypothetical protein [Virgibacillus senegalensis]
MVEKKSKADIGLKVGILIIFSVVFGMLFNDIGVGIALGVVFSIFFGNNHKREE